MTCKEAERSCTPLRRSERKAEKGQQDAADGGDISDDASTGSWLVSDDEDAGQPAEADTHMEGVQIYFSDLLFKLAKLCQMLGNLGTCSPGVVWFMLSNSSSNYITVHA